VVVVILSVVFILSGFLHLLARCLGRSSRRGRAGGISSAASQAGRSHELLAAQYYDQSAAAISALHGQLQHLFHLHDAGVEQAFIDTLPVFCYGSIRGLKDSADCAVCLNEFGEEDRLRLLPKCKHAFHLECIDTWLLSNSTCPLCRRSLLPDPIVGSAAAEIADQAGTSSNSTLAGASVAVADHQLQAGSLRAPSFRPAAAGSSLLRGGSNLCESSFRIREAAAAEEDDEEEDQCEIEVEEEPESISTPSPLVPTVRVTDSNGMCKILTVELGKVKMMQVSSQKKYMKIRAGTAGGRRSRPAAESSKRTRTASSSTAAAARRICRGAAGRSYSMGSYEYVVDPSNLELMIAPTPFPGRPQNWAPSRPTHRSALSDSIPELASAGGTPAAAAKDDLFWASRGLYNTPRTLSRVRELLSPSPRSAISAFSPVAFLDSAGSSSSPSAAGGGHVFRDHHQRQWTDCINNMESKIEAADLEGDEEEEEVHSDYLEAPSGRSMYFEAAPGSRRSTAYFEAAGSGRSIYFETPSGSFYFEADDESRSGYWSESQQNRELEESQSAAVTSDSQPQTPGQSFRARFQAAVRAKLLRTDQLSTNGAAISRAKLLAATGDEEAILHTNNDWLARRSSSLSRLPDQAAKTGSTVMSSLFRRSLSETSGLNISDDQQHLQVWDVPSSTRTAAAAAATTTASLESWKLNMSSSSSCTDQSIMAAAAGAGGGSKSKRYTLNWLVGRDRRVVYSAATPPLPPPLPPLPLVIQDAASCKETPGALC
jgi:E3 ubiquitin-protein ligase RNF38/44